MRRPHSPALLPRFAPAVRKPVLPCRPTSRLPDGYRRCFRLKRLRRSAPPIRSTCYGSSCDRATSMRRTRSTSANRPYPDRHQFRGGCRRGRCVRRPSVSDDRHRCGDTGHSRILSHVGKGRRSCLSRFVFPGHLPYRDMACHTQSQSRLTRALKRSRCNISCKLLT